MGKSHRMITGGTSFFFEQTSTLWESSSECWKRSLPRYFSFWNTSVLFLKNQVWGVWYCSLSTKFNVGNIPKLGLWINNGWSKTKKWRGFESNPSHGRYIYVIYVCVYIYIYIYSVIGIFLRLKWCCFTIILVQTSTRARLGDSINKPTDAFSSFMCRQSLTSKHKDFTWITIWLFGIAMENPL
jgi:hypothetical protein